LQLLLRGAKLTHDLLNLLELLRLHVDRLGDLWFGDGEWALDLENDLLEPRLLSGFKQLVEGGVGLLLQRLHLLLHLSHHGLTILWLVLSSAAAVALKDLAHLGGAFV
jgi:hypothetical protein